MLANTKSFALIGIISINWNKRQSKIQVVSRSNQIELTHEHS